ncbi:MAG TPA: S8 family serine peptidase [Leadbetterella sp.]|nr:S8 family serine peptidase [Leadbetterella sp.]
MPERIYKYKSKEGFKTLELNDSFFLLEDKVARFKNNPDITFDERNKALLSKDELTVLKKEIDSADSPYFNTPEFNVLPVFKGKNDSSWLMSDELFVGYENRIELETFINENGLSELDHFDFKNNNKYSLLKIRQDQELFEIIEKGEKYKSFISIEPNFTTIVNDESRLFPNQEINTSYFDNLNLIDVPQAWNITYGCKEIVIAVLDVGIFDSHESLRGQVVSGFNTYNRTLNTVPRNNDVHGTLCAGIVAGRNPNGNFKGVAPNCEIMPILIASSENTPPGMIRYSELSFTKGIVSAYENGASVLNISLFYQGPEIGPIRTALEEANSLGREGLGCIIVGAAGNSGVPKVDFPASDKSVIAVSSTYGDGSFVQKEQRWGSNYGPQIFCAAPGVNNISTGLPNKNYLVFEGTSSSAALVSGVVALMLSLKPDLTSDEVKDIIERTSSLYNHPNNKMGFGLINAKKALEYIIQKYRIII